MNKYTDKMLKLTCLGGLILVLSSGILSAETFVLEESCEFNAADFKTIEVSTMSGDVSVENADGSIILVNVIMTVKASSEEKADTAFENIDIRFEELADLLKLEVKGESSGFSIFGIGKLYPDIKVEIQCPPGINLDVDTGSGDVAVTRFKGDFTVDTGSGDVILKSVSGNVDIDTGSGDVMARDLEGDFVAGTGSGDISATGRFPQFKAGTGSGDIHIVSNIPADQDSKASTGSGDVRLELPQDASFLLMASSGSGDIRLQFLPAGDIKAHDSLQMQVGDKGPTIRVVTGSGDIAVTAKD